MINRLTFFAFLFLSAICLADEYRYYPRYYSSSGSLLNASGAPSYAFDSLDELSSFLLFSGNFNSTSSPFYIPVKLVKSTPPSTTSFNSYFPITITNSTTSSAVDFIELPIYPLTVLSLNVYNVYGPHDKFCKIAFSNATTQYLNIRPLPYLVDFYFNSTNSVLRSSVLDALHTLLSIHSSVTDISSTLDLNSSLLSSLNASLSSLSGDFNSAFPSFDYSSLPSNNNYIKDWYSLSSADPHDDDDRVIRLAAEAGMSVEDYQNFLKKAALSHALSSFQKGLDLLSEGKISASDFSNIFNGNSNQTFDQLYSAHHSTPTTNDLHKMLGDWGENWTQNWAKASADALWGKMSSSSSNTLDRLSKIAGDVDYAADNLYDIRGASESIDTRLRNGIDVNVLNWPSSIGVHWDGGSDDNVFQLTTDIDLSDLESDSLFVREFIEYEFRPRWNSLFTSSSSSSVGGVWAEFGERFKSIDDSLKSYFSSVSNFLFTTNFTNLNLAVTNDYLLLNHYANFERDNGDWDPTLSDPIISQFVDDSGIDIRLSKGYNNGWWLVKTRLDTVLTVAAVSNANLLTNIAKHFDDNFTNEVAAVSNSLPSITQYDSDFSTSTNAFGSVATLPSLVDSFLNSNSNSLSSFVTRYYQDKSSAPSVLVFSVIPDHPWTVPLSDLSLLWDICHYGTTAGYFLIFSLLAPKLIYFFSKSFIRLLTFILSNVSTTA